MFSVDTPLNLVYGAITGLVFGFLLQRGGLTRYRVIVGQFLFADNTMLKTMLTAVVVGAAGVYAMHLNPQLFGEVKLHIKPAVLAANVLGGLIFGAGMVLLGYCPGTGVAALGDGSRHATFGVLGMLLGAAAYAEVHPAIGDLIGSVCNLGKATLPTLTGLPAGVWICLLAAAAICVFLPLERLERKTNS